MSCDPSRLDSRPDDEPRHLNRGGVGAGGAGAAVGAAADERRGSAILSTMGGAGVERAALFEGKAPIVASRTVTEQKVETVTAICRQQLEIQQPSGRLFVGRASACKAEQKPAAR